MKLLFSFSLFLLSVFSFAQKTLQGLVVDAEKNQPIANASIFLSNTSVGTKADEQGNFTLNIPNGKYDLIVSSIGYETFSHVVSGNEPGDKITVKLKIKAELMQTVIIEPYEKDGWAKWGKFFLDNFIGTSENAQNCTIKNYEVIKFRNSKKTNELFAFADEPLIIENKALGYTIRYQLETFRFDFKEHYLIFTGYPFFESMDAKGSKEKKWEKKREEAYYGSMMHFMRSLFRNTIIQEGFEVRRLQKIPNNEKQRVKAAYSSNRHSARTSNGTTVITQINKDTSEYYDHILRQDDYRDVIGKEILPGDSIAYAVNNTTAGLEFNDYLLIIYKKKLAPLEYRQQFPKSSTAMQSQIVLINGKPVEVEANGNYYDPADLMSLGYWAWSEKLAMMLPFDYVPK